MKIERVTTRVTGEIGDAIRESQRLTTASSPSEVVRRAIIVYHRLVMAKLHGKEPVIIAKDQIVGEVKEPVFL